MSRSWVPKVIWLKHLHGDGRIYWQLAYHINPPPIRDYINETNAN